MRKVYHLFAALVLSVLGATTASAGEMISLEEVPFWAHESGKWATEAVKNTELPKAAEAPGEGVSYCAWILGAATGQPYGDSNVNAYADLTNFTKLVVVVTDGTPRFLMNRDVDEGQWNDNEAQCHLIDNTKGGWAAKYFSSQTTDEGTVWTVDIKQLVKDKGFAHLHAIKGANWANVTVTSMMVEKPAKATPVGWTSIINNGNLEGDDVSSFYARIYPDDSMPVPEATIVDEEGVGGSRCIKVEATKKAKNPWDNQFFIRFNEEVPAGTKYKVSFDYRADADAKVSTQSHAEPGDYIHHQMLGDINFTTGWQTFSKEGEITADQSKDDHKMRSFTFNLNELEDANNYYFDNVNVQIFKLGTMADFNADVVKVDFGFDTNIAELVKATGKPRLMYPVESATVTVNGQKVAVYSVEAFADGRFYIFLEEAASENDEVAIAFKNPTDAAYHIKYTSGAVAGQDVNNFEDVVASFYAEPEDDAYPYTYVTPIIIAAEPEDGSFNLPNSIKEFKVTFDKKADCAAIQATLNGKRMTATPADGFAEQITFTRVESGDLATGQYTINITKIYPEERLANEIFGDTTYVINVGKVEYDPNDQPKEMIQDYFAATNSGAIPEGWFAKFKVGANDEEERPGQSTYGGGPRMFDFAAGGDFTKGFYFREGYVEYGSTPGYDLTLEAGKRYDISFMAARWKSGGDKMRFEIMDQETEEVAFVKVVDCNPDVNGSQGAVNGANSYTFKFYPEATGNYILRWSSSSAETTTTFEYKEVLLAKPAVKYVPNQVGLEETLALTTALANAQEVIEANTGERYAGEAFTALTAAVQKYTAEKDGYTSPSAFTKAAEDLNALAQAMKDHRSNCDGYDTQIKKAIDVARQNAEKKFANTELYAELTSIVAKYHGTSEWVNVSLDPEAEDWQLTYSYDVLTEDDVLKAAVAELTDIANTTALLFTEGASDVSNTGVKVLVERLRLGAEALQNFLITLGADKDVAAADADVVAALDALTDDDALAKRVQNRLTKELYTELSNKNNTLFEGTFNPTTEETEYPTYDMTVFVKNPNIYKQTKSIDFSTTNVPGWTVPEGFKAPNLSWGWGATQGTDQIAEDCMFQTWGAAYRAEQTIEGLPAGIYTIKMGFGERMQDDASSNMDKSFVYVKTSDTPAVGENEEEELDLNFAGVAACPGIGQSFPHKNAVIENITVTDGKLTIGVNGSQGSHTFFNDVQILLTAPAPNFDYAAALGGLVKLGDVNGDGAVDVEDVVGIVNYILNEPASNFNEKAGDVTGDGKVDVDDVVAVVNIILDSNTAAAPKYIKYLLQNGFKF